MRLTLRTLLAYLDDILEPAQAEEIRRKVQESSFASTLMNRIREVLRRRRLPAPDLEGSNAGLDPNVVAEYLDNTLEPNAVADVERVCLESDVHLAEVAACHQILTMVLGEPVEVPPRTRERMYALVEDARAEAAQPPADATAQDAEQTGRLSQTSTTRFSDLLPDYLKPPPLWRRVLPYAVVLLVVAAWLTLFVVDPTVWQSVRAALGWQAGPEAEAVVSAEVAPAETTQRGRGQTSAGRSTSAESGAGGAAAAAGTRGEAGGAAKGAAPGTGPAQSAPAAGPSVTSTTPASQAGQAGKPAAVTSTVAQPAAGAASSPSPAGAQPQSGQPVAVSSGTPPATVSTPPTAQATGAGQTVAVALGSGTEGAAPTAAPTFVGSAAPSGSTASTTGTAASSGPTAVSGPVAGAAGPSQAGSAVAPPQQAGGQPSGVAVASVAPTGGTTAAQLTSRPAAGTESAGSTVPPAPGAAAQPSVPAPTVQYTSPSGVLLRYSPEDEDWVPLPHRSLLMPGEQFVCPEPFIAHLRVDKGLLQVALRGGTRVSLLAPTAEVPFGFEVVEGRLVLQRRPAVDAAAVAARVVLAVRVHGETWRLELVEPGTVCGLEIVRRMPDQLEQDLGPDAYVGGLYVSQGSVRFADGTHPEQVVEARQWLPLAPKDREQVAQTGTRPPLFAVPEWLEAKDDYVTDVERRYADVFEKEFQPDVPVSLSLPTVVRSRRPWLSEFAVKCLALTDHYRLVVQALAESPHEETRLAAIEGLRRWLPSDPKNGEKLKEALADFFHPDEADPVYRLLWGFNEKDASNPFLAKQLVDWLEHDHVAIRELAFYHIYRLTHQRYDYRPDAPLAQRRAAVARWRQHLKRNNDQLLGL